MNGSPSSRQRATRVASTRLIPRGRPQSSHSPIRLNGRTPSSSEPCQRAGPWSYRISSRCLKRGMLLSSIIAGTEINHGKGGFENLAEKSHETYCGPKVTPEDIRRFSCSAEPGEASRAREASEDDPCDSAER